MDDCTKEALLQFSIDRRDKNISCTECNDNKFYTNLGRFKVHMNSFHPNTFQTKLQQIREAAEAGTEVCYLNIKKLNRIDNLSSQLTHIPFLISEHFLLSTTNSTKKNLYSYIMNDRKSWKEPFILPQHSIDEIFEFLVF